MKRPRLILLATLALGPPVAGAYPPCDPVRVWTDTTGDRAATWAFLDAAVLFEQGRHGRADQLVHEALRLRPRMAEARWLQALIRAAVGDPREAAWHFEEIAGRNVEDPLAGLALLEASLITWRDLGEPERALKIADRVRDVNSRSWLPDPGAVRRRFELFEPEGWRADPDNTAIDAWHVLTLAGEEAAALELAAEVLEPCWEDDPERQARDESRLQFLRLLDEWDRLRELGDARRARVARDGVWREHVRLAGLVEGEEPESLGIDEAALWELARESLSGRGVPFTYDDMVRRHEALVTEAISDTRLGLYGSIPETLSPLTAVREYFTPVLGDAVSDLRSLGGRMSPQPKLAPLAAYVRHAILSELGRFPQALSELDHAIEDGGRDFGRGSLETLLARAWRRGGVVLYPKSARVLRLDLDDPTLGEGYGNADHEFRALQPVEAFEPRAGTSNELYVLAAPPGHAIAALDVNVEPADRRLGRGSVVAIRAARLLDPWSAPIVSVPPDGVQARLNMLPGTKLAMVAVSSSKVYPMPWTVRAELVAVDESAVLTLEGSQDVGAYVATLPATTDEPASAEPRPPESEASRDVMLDPAAPITPLQPHGGPPWTRAPTVLRGLVPGEHVVQPFRLRGSLPGAVGDAAIVDVPAGESVTVRLSRAL